MEHIDAPTDDAVNEFMLDPLLTAIIEVLRSNSVLEDDSHHADEQMDAAA